ncbi:MAG: hypothetical protein FWD48_00840 [Oscillospiraceae bacterium]|nr:hypothetical protein [Oscillospiraceae bacterium]
MKKLLLIPLAIVILIIFMSTSPPPSRDDITIGSEEELSEMRKMVEADNKEFSEYLLRITDINSRLLNREHIVYLLKILDSFPTINNSEMKFERIYYYFGGPFIGITFSNDISERYSIWHGRTANENVHNELLFTLNMNYENHVNVYSAANSQGFELDEHGSVYFTMHISNFIVGVIYNRGDNEHIQSVNPEEIFKTLFGVSPWVYVPEPFTTEEALIILQAAAGLIELSDEQRARFGIDDVPKTSDALRILRAVAGL